MNDINDLSTKITREGYHLVIDELKEHQLKTLINDLTIKPIKQINSSYKSTDKNEQKNLEYPVYKYSKNRLELIVPRYYGINKFGTPKKSYFEPEDIDVQFTKTLRDVQQKVSDRCIEYIRENGGGLLSVPCGFGKTICALYIAQKLGLKTLVIVHKSFLIKQWIRNALDFLTIKEEDIGIIRQNKCDYVNKDIVIGMIQTIAKRDFDENVFDKFGLVIFDEAHHVSSKFFSKTLFKTGAKYTLSLTATPYRGDGAIKVMYWFLGNTMYREQLKINKNVIVKLINHKSTDKRLFSPKLKRYNGQMSPDAVKMTSNLCEIKTRTNTIIDIITHIRRTAPERKILILSDRKEHLTILKKGVDRYIDKDIANGIIDANEINSCNYVGDTKLIERQKAEEDGDIIFATYAMANEGLDIKHLNTVILASPKKDVIQSIGRIMRTILKTGDVRPMIIDIADELSSIGKWLDVRTSIYKKCRYEIENYYLVDNTFKTYEQYNNLPNKRMHFENPFIHNVINQLNYDINKTNEEYKRLNMLFNINIIFDETKFEVLDDVENTDITDIFFTPKLKDQDVERIIVTSDNQNNVCDETIDEFDMLNVWQKTMNEQTKNKLPNKRLF